MQSASPVRVVIRPITAETRVQISMGPLAPSIASGPFFRLVVAADSSLVQITSDLHDLLFYKEITRVDSTHPTCLLRDLNGSGSFASAVDNSCQTHDGP